jgi:hypothetical protein
MKMITLFALLFTALTIASVGPTRDTYFCDPADPYSDDCQHL